MKLPNFLMVGTPKAGTTALYDHLSQHPQIFMSKIKEPYFFMLEGKNEVDFNGPGDQKALSYAVTSLNEYKALFADANDEIALGEASTCYLGDEKSVERIRTHVPDVKIIIGLRNPVDRAFSSYMHLRRDGRETIENFEQALEKERERIDANYEPLWHYTQSSFYYESLQRFYDSFPEENIFIYLFDDLKANSAAVVRSAYEFLGVEPDFVPETDVQRNVSGLPKNRYMHAVQQFLLQPNNPVKEMLKPLLPQRLRKRMLHNVVGKIRDANLERQTLQPEVRERVLDIFRDDILNVQDYINRDLSKWLEIPEIQR